MIHIYENNNLKTSKTTQNTILLISPRRELPKNRRVYQFWRRNLMLYILPNQEESMINTLIFGKITHFVESQGNHLGGIAELLKKNL